MISGVDRESDLLPEGLEGSTDGVDAGPLSGISEEPPRLLDGFYLWETSKSIITPLKLLSGRLLRAEDKRSSDSRTDQM